MPNPALRIKSFAILRMKDPGLLTRALLDAGLQPAFVIESVDELTPSLKSHPVDALVMDGVSKETQCAELRIPVLAIHIAPLPAYRGPLATHWAVYHDEPLEVCVTLLDQDDRGPVLARRSLAVHRGDALRDIEQRGAVAGNELLVETLQRSMSGGIEAAPQQLWEGHSFPPVMPDDILRELTHRLDSQEYSHYA